MTDPDASTAPSPLRPADAYPDPADAPALRWGILAPGGIARRFAHEIPRFTASRVVAVGSRDLGRAEAFAADHDIPRAYGSYAELVADGEGDAVYVASPHSAHLELASLALTAGRPVLVEKSLTRNAAEARELFDLAASRGLFAMEAMWSRFLPHYRAVVDAVHDGAIGEVLTVTAQHGQHLVFGPEHRLWDPALAGGAMLDLTVYPLSFAHALLGVPDQVHAFGALSELGVDTGETVVLRYGERTVAVAQASLETAMANEATIAGTHGRIDLAGSFYTPVEVALSTHEGASWRLPVQHEGGFQFQAAEVARRVATGETSSPLMSWQASVEVMELMDEARAQLGVVFPGE